MYMADFSTLLEHHSTSSAKTVMLGDFNIHVDCLEKNDAALFIDLLQSADLQQHVHCPTHTSGHTLDLVISDSDNTVVTDVRSGSFISDHESVLFELTHPKPHTQYTVVQSRKINNIDKAKFQEDFLSSSLYKSPCSDLNTLTDQYNTVVAATLDGHAPITKKCVAIKPNWLNEDFRSEKRKRRKFEQKWRKTGLIVHREIFVEQRQLVSNLMKSLKTKYYADTIVAE